MATQLTAPRMGEGVEELTLIKWLKEEGDPVRENESILEVETDKVVTELPSPASGVVLKRLVEEGLPVKVGDLLAWIGDPSEEIPRRTAQERGSEIPEMRRRPADITEGTKKGVETQPAAADTLNIPTMNVGAHGHAPLPETAENQRVIPSKKDTFLSPLVKRMLAENHLDPSQIEGTGQNGRITKQDVLVYLAEPRRTAQERGSEIPEVKRRPVDITKGVVHPISSIRRTIAQRMIESLNTSAHVLTVMEADLSRVEAHRKLNKPLFAQDGVRLTLTAYFIAAITAALKANSKVNSSWTEDGLLIHPEINIGMAVSLGEEGLIVPVIKNADTLSLLGIARQVNDLAERARTKKLLPEEVRGGTFSLTNHGMSGSLFASPIITQPQVGILGTGLVQKRAIVITDVQCNDSITIRPMVYLSFVFDHRVLDGEGADNFLRKVKETLEGWY